LPGVVNIRMNVDPINSDNFGRSNLMFGGLMDEVGQHYNVLINLLDANLLMLLLMDGKISRNQLK